MRLRSPSTTFTLTSTVSPGPNSGMSLPVDSFATCSFSSCWIRFIGILRRLRQHRGAHVGVGFGSIGASFYDNGGLLSRLGRRLFRWWFPTSVGRPEVRPALAGEPLGRGAAPGGDLAVVARYQDLGDGLPLPGLRARVLRVFEQAVGEALL